MAYPIQGMPYRLYTDACDVGLAAILQQIQPIAIKDLKGTKLYDKLSKAYKANEKVPLLVVHDSKQKDILTGGAEGVVNYTKTLEFIPIFLHFFRRLYAPASDHMTLEFTSAKLLL
jgi:hypothetical protein